MDFRLIYQPQKRGVCMKRLTSLCFLISFVLVISAGSSLAQGKFGVVGKKFNKQEANILFGKVIGTVKLTKAEMKEAIANAKEYVLFAVKNSRAHLLDEKKISLNAKNKISLRQDEKAYAFSKNVVEDFVNTSTADVFTVEVRASVLTVSDGFSTLEMATVCPPICF